MTHRVPVSALSERQFANLKRRIASDAPVIVDGGAYKGEMIDLFLLQYGSPVIHAFEANPGRAGGLRKKYAGRANVRIYPCALGAANSRIPFNILEAGTLSSALAPKSDPKVFRRPGTTVVRHVIVDQVRLDGILDGGPDILKLDLQGYELEALKGCGDLLERTGVIGCEVGFVERYEGQPLFDEIDRFLTAAGFELLELYEPQGHAGGPLTHADAVYLNRRSLPTRF
ncbi:MAG: FkbM family methyltransferase [Syntrophobacteraceae bacterium]